MHVSRTMAPLLFCLALTAAAQQDPHTMKAVGKVDPRFQSYNIEMVEVIGGRFWRPYPSTPVKDLPTPTNATPGIDPALFEQRAPIDLSNPQLRKLAAALGPAYLRVSGSWANTVYFQASDAPAPSQPPAGFGGILTRDEWKGVASFAKALDDKIVTSFSVGAGTRDAQGVWTPAQAEAFLHYTNSIGAPIAAAEFINEPTFPATYGVPKGYSGADYGRDFKIFAPIFRKDAPGALLLGPGSAAEGTPLADSPVMTLLPTDQLLKGTGAADVDVFSYHVYPAISERCSAHAPAGSRIGTNPGEALSDDFLARTDTAESFYAALRDTYAPGKPLWLTETGQAACGGDRWAATFLDSFRYLYQLGSLARRNVQVVMHNTLAASDYGLIDEKTLTPRPNYWAALLWHRTMGTTVLDPGPSPSPTLKLFAQCTVAPSGSHAAGQSGGQSGSVTLLALNLDRTQPQTLHLPQSAERYTLSAEPLQSKSVQLNGATLSLTSAGDLPHLSGAAVKSGETTLAPTTITFFIFPRANNPACR